MQNDLQELSSGGQNIYPAIQKRSLSGIYEIPVKLYEIPNLRYTQVYMIQVQWTYIHNAMNIYNSVKIKLHAFLTPASGGGE